MAGRYRNEKAPPQADEPPIDVPPPTIKLLIQRATQLRLWLFDPKEKSWYTPEEFEAKFGRVVADNERWLSTIQVRDPIEGVLAGYQRLIDIQVKLEDFTKKVIAYYKEDLSGKR